MSELEHTPLEEHREPVDPAEIATAGPFAGGGEVVCAARGVRKSFKAGERMLEVLHGVDLNLHRGEILALVGASGAGKSTLLHVLGLLDRPNEGSVVLEGRDAWSLSLAERSSLRNLRIGFVFQFYHLLPELTALENVQLPAMIAESRRGFGKRKSEFKERAAALLQRFDMAERMSHRPGQLSGGERQRVALARALFLDPPILIADEPTGNLDSATGERVLDLIFEEQERRQLSLLLVTHDMRLAERCGRTVYMADGMIEADSTSPVPD